jgi:hypothetical protein
LPFDLDPAYGRCIESAKGPDVFVATRNGRVALTHAGVTWLLRACLLEERDDLAQTREAFEAATTTIELPEAEIEAFRTRLDACLAEYSQEQHASPALMEAQELRSALNPKVR